MKNKDSQHKEKTIRNLVARYYWEDEINCAPTTIRVLARYFDLQLSEQQIEGAVGPAGMNRLEPKCGLLEGALHFIDIIGKQMQYREGELDDLNTQFSILFTQTFKSTDCSRLRPKEVQGKSSPHICEALSCKAILLAADFLAEQFHLRPKLE